MDLTLVARVAWRFRRLLLAGVALATLLALATVFKVTVADGSLKLDHRQKEMWISYGRLLVTQSGFPQGRSDLGGAEEAEVGDEPAQEFADSVRFVELATLYSKLATTEKVRRMLFAEGPIEGADTVAVVPQENEPLIEVSATADSRAGAILLAKRQIQALRTFIAQEQRDNGIAPPNRIALDLVERPGAPAMLEEQANTWIIAPRSPIKPALVFLTVCGLFFGLAMVLENARPRLRPVASEPPRVPEDAGEQPTARTA